MKSRYFLLRAVVLASLVSGSANAEYHYFNVPGGSDGIVQEVRWPYWNNAYYNTWLSDGWTSAEGVGGYFYSGLALPAAGAPNPVGTKQTINWSFWPLSNPVNITDTISSYYASPNTFSMQTIGEGTIFRSPGSWTLWQTNVWYRLAFRAWQPVSAAPHQGLAGQWLRDPVAGIWYHMATVQLPFSVTGIDGLMGFQENATGGIQPQRTDYRNCYYHRSGQWSMANQFWVYVHSSTSVENTALIENNTAVYYETCSTNNTGYTGTLTNGQTSPTLVMSNQPPAPVFDPIIVSNAAASVAGSQLLVQWQVPATSSPQFAYQVDVFNNPAYTGSPVVTFYDVAPDTRQKLLNTGGLATPYARLTIIDIFNQTNAPISITPTTATLLAATTAPGAVNGLAYAYYQSASNYSLDSAGTNWSAMPNFASLTPVLQGAVSGLDLTPRQRRSGYAFNYNGYLYVPSNGLYTFTLNSDAGSQLYLDGQLVVNWDRLHSPSDRSGWAGLQAGYHTFNLQYFCDTQSSLFGSSSYFDTLSLSYEGPGIARTAVPNSAYYRAPAGNEPAISLSSPANGAILSGASVPLKATVTTNRTAPNSVQFYVGNNYWAQGNAAPYSANAFLWANANNPIRARLTYNGTNTLDSDINLVTTTNIALAPWQFSQIFYHNYPSGASILGGTYSVIGDGMNLLSRQVSGDCTLVAHLLGLPSTAPAPDGSAPNSGWQAGIILRGNTNMVPGYPWGQTTTAPFTAVFGQVDGGTYYQDETMVNGGGGYSSGDLGGQKWFRLQRTGNTFTTSVSADGVTWTPVRTNTLSDFGTTLYAEFFTYAGPSSNPNIHWASFNSVSLTGNLLGPPSVTINPSPAGAYTAQTSLLTALPSGNPPFAYQWQYNGINLTGATDATLSLTNVQPSTSGVYTVTLTTSNGAATASSTLTVLSPSPATAQVLAGNPVGYWRLNETAGPTAYDSANNFNGTGEGGVAFGVPGAGPPVFTGFEAGNLAAQFNGSNSDIALPALNLNTNAVTIAGWVKRSGNQTPWSGMVFCRAGATTAGLHFGTANELRYTWNNSGSTYNWNSALIPPDGVWTFIALVIQPSQAIMYMATNGTLYSATNAVANPVQAFAGTTYLGYDPNSSTRRLNGVLDEVALFNYALTPQQLTQILAASMAPTPPSINLTAPASGANFAAPANLNLAASVTTNGHAISQVQFYSGSTLLGQSAAPPYVFTWTNVPAGAYTLLAQVIYDAGATTFSPPAFVTVGAHPSAPATIVPTALANNLISVSWPVVPDASGYVLSRGGVAIAWLSSTNYLDLGLSANSTYCYSVVATNVYGNSSPGATNCATTTSAGAALEWDATGSLAGPQDGNGSWGFSANTWWDGGANVAWSDNRLAIFGAGTTTNCAVVITSDFTPAGILFNLNNGGSYNLSSSGGALNLSGVSTLTANADATISAYLKGSGQLTKAGPGTLTLTAANTNSGPVIVNGGTLVATVSCWYTPRAIGSGSLTINNGALAEFTATHGFGADAGGRSATLNAGTLQFDHENYVNGLTLTAGSVIGAGEFRALGVTYTVNASPNLSVISTPINFYGSPTFNVAKGSGAVDLLVSGNISVNGACNFTKTGTGLLVLTGTDTNSATTVSGGTLQVDGTLNTPGITVQNTATLAGNGTLNAAVTIQNGGTLAPGDGALGALFCSRTVSLAGKSLLEISKVPTGLTNDLLSVAGTLTCGGSLTVTNIGSNALALGDSFKLFNAGAYAGAFTSFTLPMLALGLAWDASKLTNNGTLTVVTGNLPPPVPPLITNFAVLSDGNFALRGTGAVGQTCILLGASNLLAPVAWVPLATNTADTNGLFQFTDQLATNFAQRFYRTVTP
ncbi:MAG TPA: LamG-like jellyroll fold domain-containing protein [Candidatus Binatia bacterium]|jgi:autotransporter-associated beta strand protein|nr:LamG-like jellyroll fold domain-containing protein [Candidatus Binatia bacterium]